MGISSVVMAPPALQITDFGQYKYACAWLDAAELNQVVKNTERHKAVIQSALAYLEGKTAELKVLILAERCWAAQDLLETALTLQEQSIEKAQVALDRMLLTTFAENKSAMA